MMKDKVEVLVLLIFKIDKEIFTILPIRNLFNKKRGFISFTLNTFVKYLVLFICLEVNTYCVSLMPDKN